MSSESPAVRQTLELPVRWSEAGPDGRLAPAGWIDLAMEAADANAGALGFSIDALEPRGLAWVLARHRLAFDGAPRVRDVVRLSTWPRGFDRLLAMREFVFEDDAGRRLARATTAWLLVRRDTFRPVRPAEALPALPRHDEVALEERTEALPPLPDAEPAFPPLRLRARRSETDLLGHVSNPHYVRWALEALPPAPSAALATLAVDFLGMAFAGDEVDVHTVRDGDGWRQAIRRVGDPRDLVRVHTRWRAPHPVP